MNFSAFGNKFAANSGIVQLMDDLGSALNDNPNMLFMGGGNPAHLDTVERVFEQTLQTLLQDPHKRHSLLGIYQSPQGDRDFRRELAAYLKRQFGWPVSEHNIAVSNGSQAAFFVLYNLFAGAMPDGSQRSIHLPLAPEYLGYGDVGLNEGFFTATRPNIDLLDDQQFKYRVDFEALTLNQQTAALCVSRPTNPTGNMLTDAEIEQLDALAQAHKVPLIIDGAYGLPFPNIVFNDAKPHWNPNTILVLSLSKLGLPGVRTGMIIASEEIIQAYSNANTIVSLACGNLGPALAKELLRDDTMLNLTQQHITPFYRQRAQQTVAWLQQALAGLPFRIHKPEGAIFLWLWLEGLPITSQALYERLKQRGVLVVPGHNFFVGLEDDWRHKHECIRLSYAQDESTVKRGIAILAEEVHKAFDSSR